jgi:hypothetical protein
MHKRGYRMQWTTWALLGAACGGGNDANTTGGATEASTTAATTGGPTTGVTTDEPTGSGSQASDPTVGMTGTGEPPTTSASTTTDTGDTTQPASISDTSSASDTGNTTDATTDETASTTDGTTGDPPPIEKLCSADLHAVVDGMGQVLEACPADQGCAEGTCVPACAAAAGSKANFGCTFIVPTPPAYPPALPPCFAVFLANTVRPNPPRRPRTSRSAAIPGKRAFWRGWARPTSAQPAPVRPGFWQRFGNALATRASRPEAHRPEVFDTARARPRRSRGSDSGLGRPTRPLLSSATTLELETPTPK